MDYTTKRYIDALAKKVISAYDIRLPIKNMDDIVIQMGGIIEEKDNFDDLCDGTIRKSGDNSFCIAISKNQSKGRRKFIIAHELGHLFLHMGYRTNTEIWDKQNDAVYRLFGSLDQACQANEFAAALLMPETQYKAVLLRLTQQGRVDISEVARYFKVSNQAAYNRGRSLGYLE